MTLKKLFLLPLCALIIPLSGCEGYEMVKVDNFFPYGNERTAGSGVAYVVAKMMPKKEMKIEPAKKEVKEVKEMKPVERKIEAKPMDSEKDAVLKDMQDMFREEQMK